MNDNKQEAIFEIESLDESMPASEIKAASMMILRRFADVQSALTADTRKQAPAADAGARDDARRMRTLCRLLDAMDDLGNGFPGKVHAAFQEGAKVVRATLDRFAIPEDDEARTALASEQQCIVDRTPPFANCRFRECDLPGQCRAEGKCHHPASEQQAAPNLAMCSEAIREAILSGDRYAMGLALGLASLARDLAAKGDGHADK